MTDARPHPDLFAQLLADANRPPGRFWPLVNARDAAVLAEWGLREGVDFLRYPDPPASDEHSMLRAIEARKHRNTGPSSNRLDGCRRKRR